VIRSPTPAVERMRPTSAQDTAKRVPEVFGGKAIDSGLTVPGLTEYERLRLATARPLPNTSALASLALLTRLRLQQKLGCTTTDFAAGISAKFGVPKATGARQGQGDEGRRHAVMSQK
jgi:hypothetical protein